MPVALITGANRGIGLSLTRQLVRRGHTVIACHRSDPGEIGRASCRERVS